MLKRLFTLFFLLPLFTLCAHAEDFVAGKDYDIIKPTTQTEENHHKIPIIEFFSFGCPGCYRVEPALEQWVKEQHEKIEFLKVPVVFHKDWLYYAKAYYTANLLGMSDKLSPLLFKTVQVDKIPLNNNQAMIDFFVNHGVDKETAESAFNHSPTLDIKVTEGNEQMASFHITGIPAFVINDQYKTDLQMAQTEERLIKILNYLVNQVHK